MTSKVGMLTDSYRFKRLSSSELLPENMHPIIISTRLHMYCVKDSFEQNKSLSRTFLIYISFVLGFFFHVLGITYFAFFGLIVIEAGIFDDAWSAVVLCALLLITIALAVTKRIKRDEDVERIALLAIMLTIGARSVRAESWFCRTFRGEHQLASILSSVVIGYGASVLIKQGPIALRVVSVVTIASTISFMSPWHDLVLYGLHMKGVFYALSFIGVGIVCAFRARWQWTIFAMLSLLLFVVGVISSEFQHTYLHVIVLSLTMTQILITLP